MTPKRPASDIEEEAAYWVNRLEAHDLTQQEALELETWLQSDLRCVGALARAEAYVEATKKAAAFDTKTVQALSRKHHRTFSPDRRAIFRLGALGTGAALLGVAGWTGLAAAKTHRTHKGETKVVSLSDGSIVHLNTETTLKVDFGRHKRSVELIKGEALFDVTPEPGRPFFVRAADRYLRSEGSHFSVSLINDRPLTIRVTEGVVRLNERGREDTKLLALEPNTLAEVGSSADQKTPLEIEVKKVAPEQIRDDLAWKSGRIIFRGETLSEAVEELRRYSDIIIVIDDKSLAEERIAGVFQNNDPIGFAKTVAGSFDLSVAVEQNKVRLKRKNIISDQHGIS